MTELVKFSGGGTGLMSRDDLARSLNNVSTVAPRVGGEFQYLKMDKGNGDWVYGQEETLVEEGALWAVNPNSLEYGYISWDGNQQVEGEVMVPISRPLPAVNTLRVKDSPDGQPTGQNGWQYQQSVVLVCINGEDEGTVCQYKQSSVGSQKLFKSLVDSIMAQVSKGSDAIVPIIKMKSDSYKHKKYGRIYNPLFEVVEWRTMDDTSAPDEAAAEEPEAKEPERAPRTRGAAAKPATETAPPAEGSAAEEEALAAEYAAEQEAQQERAPRRRVRR